MLKLIRNIVFTVVIFLLIMAGVSALSTDQKVKAVSVSEVVNLVNGGRVESVVVDQSKITAKVKDSDTRLSATLGHNTEFITLLKDSGVSAESIRALQIEYKLPGWGAAFMSNILPILLPFLLISLFVYFLMRQVQGTNNRAMSFGQSSVRLSDERKNKVRFADVAGAKEAKEELKEVVEFLRFPQKFLQLGAKIPKGVLLLGSPGVGKTLLARAVAGEANVPFFHISGSEFVEMFVGVGASRVRDLFRKAKRNSPCIVFIDEIDAVGRQRGTGLGGGHDEREQTLNQILVEMDGFETETNVIVIAATNRPDVLDPALLRPGRFDRQVVLDLPDIKDREEILKVHAQNKPLAPNVNLKNIAERTPGFSGADLANLLNEGAILAARANKQDIDTAELREAIEKVMLGPKRASHILSPAEKKVTAYHEGGHALIGAVLPEADPVHKVTILSRGRAAGYTMKLPNEEKHMQTKNSFLDEIAALLGGYAAEKLVFNELTTGASNDLKVATNMARKLVTTYGMSDTVGPVTLAEPSETVFLGREIAEHKNYSEQVAAEVDTEIRRIMREQLERATRVLAEHRSYLDTIAERLVSEETLEQEQFHEIVKEIIPKGKIKEVAVDPKAPTAHIPTELPVEPPVASEDTSAMML
ncbi:MAG: ATP-dependent zinc metalloprotease FtsH [Candidatus Doudnabacteria bacterium]|nr:ATP-dependent zinc metalloprotease FtsH [Candidatus Doudnabacteria bacterium]